MHAAAGIPHGGLETSDEAIQRGMDSIVMAAFWLVRAARPWLQRAAGGGGVVFITSVCGPRTIIPGRLAYAVTKSALETFVRGAALELAREDITVNAVAPGFIESARVQVALPVQAIAAIGYRNPVPRAGRPDEVPDAVLQFSPARAGFVTGATLVVDGGSSLSTVDLSGFLVGHQACGARPGDAH